MPDRAVLDMYQGDDYSGVVTVFNADGTFADISIYTAMAQIRRKVADQDPVIVAQLSATIQSPYIFLGLPHDQSILLSGAYVWDLQIALKVGGSITTILAGPCHVCQDVTRQSGTLAAALERSAVHA